MPFFVPPPLLLTLSAAMPGCRWATDTTQSGVPYVALTLPPANTGRVEACLFEEDQGAVLVTYPPDITIHYPTMIDAVTSVLALYEEENPNAQEAWLDVAPGYGHPGG